MSALTDDVGLPHTVNTNDCKDAGNDHKGTLLKKGKGATRPTMKNDPDK